MKKNRTTFALLLPAVAVLALTNIDWRASGKTPVATLLPSDKYVFRSFVDCNMAEAWIGDTFRIFPGKYGEDPVWGYARDLKFADGNNADAAFSTVPAAFITPQLPPNVEPHQQGLHGAVWFETVYQDKNDPSGKTLYAVYHNENYPATFPYNAKTGKGYIDKDWPEGLTGPTSAAAVCRIGIMRSADGGHSWADRGIFIEDEQPRMILKPINTSKTFAGGVGDPSAVASGGYLYLFYGEYGYPGKYASGSYDAAHEMSGQCISMARIKLSDLDHPTGKARRWDGRAFHAPYNGIGKPIATLQIPATAGGGPASQPKAGYYWGPSVSWNTYLNAWVMLMAKSEGPSWKGDKVYVSYNTHADLGASGLSQQWSSPQLLISKPGHTLWYPALQPTASPTDVRNKNTCLRLGQQARLFYKDTHGDTSEYVSEYKVQFNLQ